MPYVFAGTIEHGGPHMPQLQVNFIFHSGVKRHLFSSVRLSGSWNAKGLYSAQWTEVPMAAAQDETGCDAFTASAWLDASQIATRFRWGVVADLTDSPNTWAVVTEVPDENSDQRYRSFALGEGNLRQDYWLVIGRRFGAQKYFPPGVAARPSVRFSVWAPHARNVEVVFAAFDLSTGPPSGYIADD